MKKNRYDPLYMTPMGVFKIKQMVRQVQNRCNPFLIVNFFEFTTKIGAKNMQQSRLLVKRFYFTVIIICLFIAQVT